MEWVIVGEIASVVQITVTLKLIYAIVAAAKHARMHKRNCRQFASHLKMIARLLEQLKPQDVEEFPEYRATREPLEHLDLCLKKALVLVENCRDKSYLYLIAMGWSIVGQFKEYQAEIDRYLRLVPLITLVENHKEKLRAIERDRREYTLDEEEKKIYSTLLKDSRTRDDAVVLQRSLSRSYPGLCLERALREENEKLSAELQRKQRQMDLDQCDVIEHLLEVTKTVNMSEEEREKMEREKLSAPTHSRTSTMESIESGVSVATNWPHGRASHPIAPPKFPESPPPPPSPPAPPPPPPPPPPPQVPVGSTETHGTRLPRAPSGKKKTRRTRPPHVPASNPAQGLPTHQIPTGTVVAPRPAHPPASNAGSFRSNDHGSQNPRATHVPTRNSGHDGGNQNGPWDYPRWHNGLYDCCMDPFLCISTFLYPCGTFTNIAAVVSDGEITQELACHDLAFHSLFLGCCIYTCCFRRKLRKRFHISGGSCDDCWAHIWCCCCALVQEWREIQAREDEGLKVYKMRVPSQQTMENYRPRPSRNNQERYTG